MASDPGTVEYIQDQAGLGAALAARKMFGEYALYLRGKVVAFVCDNQLFLKPTAPGRAFLGQVQERPPYPGGKPHFPLEAELDDRDRLRQALLITEAALPPPAPKRATKPARPVGAANTKAKTPR